MVERMLTAWLIAVCFLGVNALPRRQSLNDVPCGKYGTQAEANACARRDFAKAEAEMKDVHEQLIAELAGRAGEGRRKLEKAQSLWLQYREAACESEASIYEGGSIRPAIYNACLAGVTRERAGRLRGFLDEIRGRRLRDGVDVRRARARPRAGGGEERGPAMRPAGSALPRSIRERVSRAGVSRTGVDSFVASPLTTLPVE